MVNFKFNNQDNSALRTFQAHVLTTLKETKHVPDEIQNVNDYRVRHAIETFAADAEGVNIDTLEEAIDSFSAWVTSYPGIPPVAHKVWGGYVEVSFSVPTNQDNAVTLTLGDRLDAEADQEAVDERLHALADMLRAGYVALINRRGAFGVPRSRANAPGNAHAPAQGAIPIKSLLIDTSNGKRVHKIKGGEYSEFGVRVWEEVLDKTGLDYKNMSLGEHAISGYFWCAYKDDGKPKKVINIELA